MEAIASGCVVICDSNPYVKHRFGDTLLYFDHTLKGDEMANQVMEHVVWIRAYPDEARDKARKAQQIWLRNFTMEHFVDNILRVHADVQSTRP